MLFSKTLCQLRRFISYSMAKQVIDNQKCSGVRLPKSIKPVHYDLSLKPNFDDFTFAGSVRIKYQIYEKVSEIVLHSKELTITDGSIENQAKKNPLGVVTYNPKEETAILGFQDDIVSEGTICLNFTGSLNDQMKGFYRTSFKIDNSDVYAATTQFEATDARRCFPCWDEPAVKATFAVSLTFGKYMTVNGKQYERLALSNMPEVSRSGPDSEVEVKFAETPIMSTYLLAFVIGPFEAIEGTDNVRPIRVFTTPGKQEQGRFALEVACKSLSFYEQYFNIKYPLPKMDLIAIPDFMSGAMENWGLVTYRETCLLFDPANTSTNRKQWIALVVAHELAHQWFGNLVTMEWWTHLWLNEGFASFMEYLCVDYIFPEYDIWSQFVTDSHGSALRLDALHNSHPIEVPVGHSSEIDEIFDDISYSKGAAVIRMLYTYIGDENFRKGMEDYLRKFAYKNTQTEDLWDCLETASKKPVRKIMSSWTAQKGYPVLSVGYTKEGDKTKLTISQSKFSSDGMIQDEDSKSIWMLPISAVTGNNPSKPQEICLLEGKSAEVVLEGVADSWIKLNPGAIGLYRCNYSEEMFIKLAPVVSQQILPPMDRLNLQSDIYALCQAGKVSSVDLLKLLLSFKGETDYTVWESIDGCMGRLSILIWFTDYKDKLQAFGRELYSEIFNRLGWTAKPGEGHTVAMLRALVIRRLIIFNHEKVVEEAKRLYKVQLDGGAAVPADLRGAVYRAASAYGDDATFESLFTIYKTAEMSEEKCRSLQALGSASDSDRLRKVLDLCMSNEVRKQDKIFILMAVGATNPCAAWSFYKENCAALVAEYGASHLMTRIVKSTSENFASEEMAQEVLTFFEANQVSGAERTVKQCVESIKLNAAWLARDSASMKEFLAGY